MQRIQATVVLLSLALLVAVAVWGYSYDDAFITYRYADNLAAGRGLIYNPDEAALGPGEAVLGTTAPGYAALLGGLAYLSGWLGLGVPQWGTLLSVAGLLAVALLPLWSGGLLPRELRLSLPLLWGALMLLLRWNVELFGAETLPILGLVVAANFCALVHGRPLAAGLLIAAAMVLRLDAGLAAASLGLVWWGHRRRFPWVYAVAGLIPVVLAVLVWTHLYGSPVPNSMLGKQAEWTQQASYTLTQWHWLRRTLPLSGVLTLLGLAVTGFALVLRRGVWGHPVVVSCGLWLVMVEVFYRLVRVPFAPWYHVYLINALVVLAVYAALAGGQHLLAYLGKPRLPALALAALTLPVAIPSAGFVQSTWRQPPDPRYVPYAAIGRHLSAQGKPGAVVAVEIGILGYFSGLPVVDLSGLISRRELAAKKGGTQSELMAELRPRYVVYTPSFERGFPVLGELLEDPRYAAVASFESHHPDDGDIILLALRE